MFYKIDKYGEFNNYDLLKNMAFFAMLIDHLGFFLFPNLLWLRLIGRISFPIFAVLHGISFKNNTQNNNISLLIYGALTSSMFLVFFNMSPLPLNILFCFYLANFIFEKINKLYQANIFFTITLIIASIPAYMFLKNLFEYGTFVLLFMLAGKTFNKVGKNLIDILCTLVIFALYIFLQSKHFGFNNYQIIIFVILILFVYLLLYNFSYREYYHLKSNKLLLFISRYSLELYFWHMLFLSLILLMKLLIF